MLGEERININHTRDNIKVNNIGFIDRFMDLIIYKNIASKHASLTALCHSKNIDNLMTVNLE